jgi:hypothetical protein
MRHKLNVTKMRHYRCRVYQSACSNSKTVERIFMKFNNMLYWKMLLISVDTFKFWLK